MAFPKIKLVKAPKTVILPRPKAFEKAINKDIAAHIKNRTIA